MAKSGRIEIFLGPMFSGKTSSLLERSTEERLAGHPVVVYKPIHLSGDRDPAGAVRTHGGLVIREEPHTLRLAELRIVEVVEKDGRIAFDLGDLDALEPDAAIAINEGQFFANIVEFADLAAERGHSVYVAGCDGTWAREPFGRILELIPKAEHVEKLSGICMECRTSRSSFSGRTGSSTEVVLIGGLDDYRGVCRACYMRSKSAR